MFKRLGVFAFALALCALSLAAQNKPLNPMIDSILPPQTSALFTDAAAMVPNTSLVETRLRFIRDSLKLQLVVVTMATTGAFDVADVAREIGRKWRVAQANDSITSAVRNTGGVILLVKDSRKCRVEVATGSEGYLTDGNAAQLCRDAAKFFKTGDFEAGLITIANGFVERHTAELMLASRVKVPETPIDWSWLWYAFWSGIGASAVWIAYIYRRNKREERETEEWRVAEAERARVIAEHKAEWKEKNRKINEAYAREQAEQAEMQRLLEIERWNALTPEEQIAEIAAKEAKAARERHEAEQRRIRQAEQDRIDAITRAKQDEVDRANRTRRQREQDDEDDRRRSYSSPISSPSSDSSSSSSSSDYGSSSSSGGGSDSFSGGGGGSDW